MPTKSVRKKYAEELTEEELNLFIDTLSKTNSVYECRKVVNIRALPARKLAEKLGFKSEMAMVSKVPDGVIQNIKSALDAGVPIADISKVSKINKVALLDIIRNNLGVNLADPKYKLKLSHDQIIGLHREGMTLVAIGSAAGCTRERIRQILQMYGESSKRQISKEMKKIKESRKNVIKVLRKIIVKKQKEIKKQKFIEKYGHLINAWNSDVRWPDIVKISGMSERDFNWVLFRGRYVFGLFKHKYRPYRYSNKNKRLRSFHRRVN
jgi:hypothetical protein